MRTCAYIGSLWPDLIPEHLAEMQERGFDRICLPVPEDDYAWRREGVRKTIETSVQHGVPVQADPWGVGNLFGFGAHSGLLHDQEVHAPDKSWACPTHQQVLALLAHWLEAIADMGATSILWDEPRLNACDHCGKRGFIWLLSWLCERAHGLGLENEVALHGWSLRLDIEAVALIPEIDIVSLSLEPPKPQNPLKGELAARRFQVETLVGITGLNRAGVWIPAYSLSAKHSLFTRNTLQLVEEIGVPRLGVWGFRACKNQSVVCDDPDLVWDSLL